MDMKSLLGCVMMTFVVDFVCLSLIGGGVCVVGVYGGFCTVDAELCEILVGFGGDDKDVDNDGDDGQDDNSVEEVVDIVDVEDKPVDGCLSMCCVSIGANCDIGFKSS